VGYRSGGGEIIAILPELKCSDAGAVTLRLPTAKFVYDLRQHRFLGHLDRVSGMLVAGEPLIYAVEDSPAARLEILARGKASPAVRAGATVHFALRLNARSGPAAPSCAAHVEVRNPRGQVVEYYGTNLPLATSPQDFAVALALNDLPGRWSVTVREPYAHQTAAADFLVERAVPPLGGLRDRTTAP
jgi:hypothetical protein